MSPERLAPKETKNPEVESVRIENMSIMDMVDLIDLTGGSLGVDTKVLDPHIRYASGLYGYGSRQYPRLYVSITLEKDISVGRNAIIFKEEGFKERRSNIKTQEVFLSGTVSINERKKVATITNDKDGSSSTLIIKPKEIIFIETFKGVTPGEISFKKVIFERIPRKKMK